MSFLLRYVNGQTDTNANTHIAIPRTSTGDELLTKDELEQKPFNGSTEDPVREGIWNVGPTFSEPRVKFDKYSPGYSIVQYSTVQGSSIAHSNTGRTSSERRTGARREPISGTTWSAVDIRAPQRTARNRAETITSRQRNNGSDAVISHASRRRTSTEPNKRPEVTQSHLD